MLRHVSAVLLLQAFSDAWLAEASHDLGASKRRYTLRSDTLGTFSAPSDARSLADLQAVTEWTIEPEAAHPLQRATEVPGAVGQVHFGRAGPDPSPGAEELLKQASKQHKYQRRRGFQLPEHDVSPHASAECATLRTKQLTCL